MGMVEGVCRLGGLSITSEHLTGLMCTGWM